MYKFLTIFLPCENVHLIKDVGMLPYVLHNEHSVDSTIASYKNGQYEYIETEVKGLKQVFIQKAFNSDLFNIIYFLLKNHKKFQLTQPDRWRNVSLTLNRLMPPVRLNS